MPDHTAWLGNLAGWHWEQVRHHLLLPKPKPEGGQPRVPDRQRFEGGLWSFQTPHWLLASTSGAGEVAHRASPFCQEESCWSTAAA